MGEGGGGVWAVKIQTCRGGSCLGLHFARFHGGEREHRAVKGKSHMQALDLLKI